MKNIGKLLVAGVVALALAGCATQGAPFKEQEVKLAKPAATDGRIFLFRSSALGFAIQPNVTVNGTVVGTAVPNAVFFVDRPKGTYEIAASTEVEKKLTFTLEAGETKFVRLTPTFGVLVGRIVPELVDAETAKKEMLDLTLITPEIPKK
jgi:hypothetical protein